MAEFVNNQSYVLESDNFFAIFVYVVKKARVASLQVEYSLAFKYLTENFVNSHAGYYLASLEACIKHLIDEYQ